MYKTNHYRENNRDVLLNFMRQYYFAVLVANGEEYPVCTHLPLEIIDNNGKIILRGHMMKDSDHYRQLLKEKNVLAVFNGPDCYVSASWYAAPPQASTWNYMTVHAAGTLTFQNAEETKAAVKRITDQHEGLESHAAFDKLPAGYVDKMVPHIVAFEIEIMSLENVFKLSQNQSTETRKNIIEALSRQDADDSRAIAGEIRKRL